MKENQNQNQAAKKITCKILSSEKPLGMCQSLAKFLEANMAPRLPLRFRPVIISGPNDGFIVCELGFAEANDFTPIR